MSEEECLMWCSVIYTLACKCKKSHESIRLFGRELPPIGKTPYFPSLNSDYRKFTVVKDKKLCDFSDALFFYS